MKRLLTPLLAALALPTSVNAETWWLVLTTGKIGYSESSALAMERIEMGNEKECKDAIDTWKNSIAPHKQVWKDALCIKGK